MARGINKVTLIGNLGADPEERVNNDNTVTRISVATTDSFLNRKTEQREERTEWHRVVFFNRLAEIAAQYLRKGSKVYIEGTLRTSNYTDGEGIKRYSTDIIAREMQMLDSRGGGMGDAPAEQSSAAPAGDTAASSAPAAANAKPGQDWDEDDIPF